MKRLSMVVVMATLVLWAPGVLADAPLVSPHYKVSESFIGGGGLINEQSSNYAARESIGDIGVGNSSSTNYQTNSGYTTTGDPALTFIVTGSTINFGTLTNATTATATVTFSVIDYTSYGYNIIAAGNTPSNGTRNLTNMVSTATSQPGTEQFGMNLRANTSPTAFGADPAGGLGTYASGYGTVNQYKYIPGATIASSAKSSGQTNFTASYIVNASVTTGGGAYKGTQTLICVGTY